MSEHRYQPTLAERPSNTDTDVVCQIYLVISQLKDLRAKFKLSIHECDADYFNIIVNLPIVDRLIYSNILHHRHDY